MLLLCDVGNYNVDVSVMFMYLLTWCCDLCEAMFMLPTCQSISNM